MTPSRGQEGFSLLEVMIAFAIIVVIVFVTVITQSGSIASSARNRNVIVATTLARNLINEQEVKYEGTALDQLPKKESDNFAEPYAGYKWTVEYAEVDFSAMADLVAKQLEKPNGEGADEQVSKVIDLFQQHLKKSVRRMTVTVEWPEGTGTSSQAFTQLVVNYDVDLSIAL